MRLRNLLRSIALLSFVLNGSLAFAQAPLTKVKMSEGSRNFNLLPVYIAIQNGYFASEAIDPELITLKGGPAAASALVSGNVDVGFTLTESVIKLRQQGKQLKVAAVIQDKNPCVIVVAAGNSAKSLKDLKGQAIGVTATGSLTDLVLRQYIEQQGMSPSDFKITAFGTPATVNLALEKGEIPAAVTITPFLTRLELGNKIRIIHDFRGDIYPGQSMLVRVSDLDGNKGAVIQKVVNAIQKGTDTLYNNEEETIKAAKAFFPNMDPQLLEAAIRDDTKKHAMFAAKLTVPRDEFQKWEDSLMQQKLLPAPLSYDEVFLSR